MAFANDQERVMESCEHCGPLPDGTPYVYDGNTVWCMYCAVAGDWITEEFFQKVKDE